MADARTIAAIITPAGTGGVAVIRLSGPEAVQAAARMWSGVDLERLEPRHASLGTVVNPVDRQPIDQALVTVFRAPASFTGEDCVELSIHGSRFLQQHILGLLTSLPGVRLAEPGEFTRRAFIAGNIDLPQAEAIADLIAARSEAAGRLALSQLRGTLSRRIEQLRLQLLDLAALMELELDFSDQEVEFADRSRLVELAEAILSEISGLHDSFSLGNAILEGVPVTIAGPVNAGKSSLLNRLVGDDRAIVSDTEGTTRDVVTDTINLGPYRLRLNDTAGLREATDSVEAIGIERSRAEARRAHILLLTLDATALPDTLEPYLPQQLPPHIIVLLNKTDLTEQQPAPAWASDHNVLNISARTGEGIPQLLIAIREILDRETPADDAAVVTNARHAASLAEARDALRRTLDALAAGIPTDLVAQDLRQALDALATLTGAITTPDLLQTLFSRFCIGK